ncbi:MAG: histone deacetylase [Pseudomonadota bacterium]
MQIVHHPDYQIPLRPGHRFPMSKYGYVRTALAEAGLLPPAGYLAPAPISAPQASMAHDPGYVARVFGNGLAAEEVKRLGLPDTPKVTRRARLASAGTLLAGWLAIEHGLALNTAGGSHHATGPGGAGFCVFNDVAVAVCNLLAQGAPAPVLVVDADVHQGDGTARIFAEDPRVFTFSIHAARNYPDQKARSDLDIALEDGLEDDDYLASFARGLDQALERAAPRMVFYNAGVDVFGGDRLGRLRLSLEGIRAREAHLLRTIRGAGLPLVCVLGGGYGAPDEVARRHLILFEEASRHV